MSRKDQFKNEVRTIVKDIEKSYKEMLASMKFQNKTEIARDQRSKQIRTRAVEEDPNNETNEDSEYIFEHELSKENRMQISLTRLMGRLDDLSRLNGQLREYVIISTDSEPPASKLKETAAMMQGIVRRK